MILVDTSVWVDHLRHAENELQQLLTLGQVCSHPMIIGELACGNLKNRATLLSLLGNLPSSVEASHQEVLTFLESKGLMGTGIGFIDLHLLASCLLSGNTWLWTRDKRLANVAHSLNIRKISVN